MATPDDGVRIHVLPQQVINKIAAGEVVERPASVVKELVENSLDAGATRVEVTLVEGGARLIRVVDDGEGMSAADVGRAFLSHATSKLRDTEDLFNVHTMGFRGEALASIGAVSQARIVSRERGAMHGSEVAVRGGELGPVREAGSPEGATVEVRNLFLNTPVRRKFLKSGATELRHATEALTRLALAHPEVTFHLTHGKRPVLRLPGAEGTLPRLQALFGADIADQLLPVNEETPALNVTGHVGPPSLARSSTQMQYVFLNGRYIRDRAIHRAIIEAYRGRMVSRTYPVVCLYLWMDPGRVDVNVHPTKIEVRFRDPGAVYALVLTAIERALAAAAGGGVQPQDGGDRQERVARAMQDFFATQRPRDPERQGFRPGRGAPPDPSGTSVAPGEAPPPAQGPALGPRNVMQVGGSYIIEETDEGFRVIDQHALHERLLYAELAARAQEAAVSRQRLLIPGVVELKPADFLLAMELREGLGRMGLEVAEFGENTVAVHTVPHMIRDADPGRLLCELLEDLREGNEGAPGATREEKLLRALACRGAVKAGKTLSRGEMEALLDRRDRTSPEPTCPHGRPHTLTFRTSELERKFHRR